MAPSRLPGPQCVPRASALVAAPPDTRPRCAQAQRCGSSAAHVFGVKTAVVMWVLAICICGPPPILMSLPSWAGAGRAQQQQCPNGQGRMGQGWPEAPANGVARGV